MKTDQIIILGLVWVISFLFACGPGAPKNQEQESETNDITSISRVAIFENDYAQVMHVTLNPGEGLAPHEGPNRLVYSLSDYTIDWTGEEASPIVKNWKKGDVHVHEAGALAVKNSGSTPAEWLAFIRKNESLPAIADQDLDKDVNSLEGGFAKRLFDDGDFRATEVRLAAGETIPLHDGINRVIYALSGYTIRYQGTEEDSAEETFKKGDVHWHDAGRHALENIGDTEAHFLIVAYKR
jgi:quercetin dioxygenase-like cupin family protein